MISPIPSATAVILKDTSIGPKVLLLKRNSNIAYGGCWVFPGGKIDEKDYAIATSDPIEVARAAAVRETKEEAGMTLIDRNLLYFSHWTTPDIHPKRFSTCFFLVSVTKEDVSIDGGEIKAFEWCTPTSAIVAHAEKRIELAPPTFVTLSQLEPFITVSQMFEYFSGRPALRIIPKILKTSEGQVALYDGDSGYETVSIDVTGKRHRLMQPIDGKWRYIREIDA